MAKKAITRLLESVSRKNFAEANELLSDIMQQKVALRLESERKKLMEMNELSPAEDTRIAKEVVKHLNAAGFKASLDSGHAGDFPYVSLANGDSVTFGHLDSETWGGLVLDRQGHVRSNVGDRGDVSIGVKGTETNARTIADAIIRALRRHNLR